MYIYIYIYLRNHTYSFTVKTVINHKSASAAIPFLEPQQPRYIGEIYYLSIHTVPQHPPCRESLYMG